MRLLQLSGAVLLAALYGRQALDLYREEQGAQSNGSIALTSEIHHPEALINQLRHELAGHNFSESALTLIRRALAEAPADYRPPFFLAAFYANRLEAPERARLAFQVAVERYPSNGRLHLEYGRWLLTALPGDPRPAEEHLRTSLRLEPELTAAAITLLQESGVPPARWLEVVPAEPEPRRQLLSALAASGHREEALTELRALVESSPPDLFPQEAGWALEWGDARLALEISERWREVEQARGRAIGAQAFGSGLAIARARLALGESDAAYQVIRDTLEDVERRFGAGSPPVLDLLCAAGGEYLGRGQVLLARSFYAEAVTLSPRYVPAVVGLARTAERSGDGGEALARYQEVLTLDRSHTEAEIAVRRLLLRDN